MPVSIVADAGSASANSFATLAETETYVEGLLNTSLWDAATTDNKNRALVAATRVLSARAWKGERATDTQALAWPRQWADDPDSTTDQYYSSTIVPQRVKNATMELAYQAIKAGTTDIFAGDSLRGVVTKTVDVLSTTYDQNKRPQGLQRFDVAWGFIAPLVEGAAGSFRVVRG